MTNIDTVQIDGEPKGIVYIRAWIANVGNAKSGESKTEFKVNGKTWVVNTPAIKASKWIKVKVRWDVRKLNGDYTITVRSDVKSVVREKSETNNVATLRVRVRNKTVTNGTYSGP